MVFKELRKEDGYTIVEVLIALSIISVVLALVSSVFVFVNQQMTDWKADTDFYNNYHVVQNKVFNDILASDDIAVNDSSIILKDGNSKEKIYSLSSGKLWYNSNELSIADIDSIAINISSELNTGNTVTWSIEQKHKGKGFVQDFVVSVRKPKGWTSLRETKGASF